jgi:hypothetical protein
MNINNIILISVCVILIIYYYNLTIEKNTIESFQDDAPVKLSFGDYLDNNDYITTYERAIISKGLPFACSVLPHSKHFDHSYCGEDYDENKKKIIFPVHIIIDYNGKYLALFNDSSIRKKNSITDNFWNNPLNNSVANQPTSNFGSNDQIVPMRMITFDGGNNLLGVGFDNKLYIKEDKTNLSNDDPKKMMQKEKTYENRWQDVSTSAISDGIIYILYKQYNQDITVDIDNSKDIALVLDTDGKLYYYSYNEDSSAELVNIPINNNLSLIKIYFDQYGYLLGLSNEFKLYRSKKQIYYSTTYLDADNKSNNINISTDTENNIIPGEIMFDENKPNPTPLLDVIYDYDSRLFGLGIFPARKRTILMKQKYECNNCFFSTTFGFSHEVTNFYSTSETDKIKLSKEDILKLKSGYDIGITQIKKYPELNDINAAYEKSSLNARRTLRKYCKKYNNKKNTDSKNFDMINRIEEQEKKIDDLNTSIAQMIKFDPDKKKIQEDIGVFTF